MSFAVIATLLSGLWMSLRSASQPRRAAERSELIGGGLLATGFVMLGVGLSAFVEL